MVKSFANINNNKIVINDSGYWGIDTTNPQTKLQVGQSLYVDTINKHVGINISNPEEDLEVDGSIQIDSAQTARLKFQKSGQGSHALGEIDGEEDGTTGGDLQFFTKVDGGSVTEKLRINNVGAIGLNGTNFGTSGQFLKSNSSTNPVSWDDITTEYISDFNIVNPTNNQLLVYNSINSKWENKKDITVGNFTATGTMTVGAASRFNASSSVNGAFETNGVTSLYGANGTNSIGRYIFGPSVYIEGNFIIGTNQNTFYGDWSNNRIGIRKVPGTNAALDISGNVNITDYIYLDDNKGIEGQVLTVGSSNSTWSYPQSIPPVIESYNLSLSAGDYSSTNTRTYFSTFYAVETLNYTRVRLYTTENTANFIGYVAVSIYSDSNNDPDQLLTYGESYYNNISGLNELIITLNAYSLIRNTKYWIGIASDTTSGTLYLQKFAYASVSGEFLVYQDSLYTSNNGTDTFLSEATNTLASDVMFYYGLYNPNYIFGINGTNYLSINEVSNQNVSGPVTFEESITASTATFDTLTVNGTSTFTGALVASTATFDTLTVNGTSTFTGALVASTATFDTLTVNGTSTFTGALVASTATLDTLTVNGTLTVDGTSSFADDVTINGIIIGHVYTNAPGWYGIRNANIPSAGNGDFALVQNGSGHTVINSSSGEDLSLQINNSTKLQINSDGTISAHNTIPSNSVAGATTPPSSVSPINEIRLGLYGTGLNDSVRFFSENRSSASTSRWGYALVIRNKFSIRSYVLNGATVYTTVENASSSSDDRLKFNETLITDGLATIRQLEPVTYDKSDDLNDSSNTLLRSGFIAQQVHTIPALAHTVVEGDEQREWSLFYEDIFTHAVAAIKELDATVQSQQTEINLLKSKLNELLTEAGKDTI